MFLPFLSLSSIFLPLSSIFDANFTVDLPQQNISPTRCAEIKGELTSQIWSSFHELLEKAFPVTVSEAKYEYLDVLDQNADSRDTMQDVLVRLYQEFNIGDLTDHLVVTGDAKTYQHLQSLKLDYDQQLSWLIPFPGDFHILMNYQPILSKVYFDAGLKQIASAGGFKGETLTSLKKCSHFKHTHHFFLESWEALYLHMLDVFISEHSDASRLLKDIAILVQSLDPSEIVTQSCEQVQQLQMQFNVYIVSMSEKDANWRFWGDFIHLNCFAYIALFCAIRSGNWHLRIGALKLMAPLFSAFDRPTYRKVIPMHLADCILLPADITTSFCNGGFSISITGRPWHSVGIDEAHEMLINKDCKLAVVHPNKEFITRLSLYFPFRSKVLHNIKKQIFPNRQETTSSSSSTSSKAWENTLAMKKAIQCSELLPLNNTSKALRNSFSGQIATPSQEEDLLNFRKVGQADFDTYVQHVYLGSSSVPVKTKFHKLKTFATTKVTKKLVNQLHREKNLVTKCLKSRLLWAQMHDGDVPLQEQYLELPRALADESGIPNKGQKSNSTAFYNNRYGEQVIMSQFPLQWIPDAVILEGMFMINATPLRIHSQMSEYTRFLLVRYAG